MKERLLCGPLILVALATTLIACRATDDSPGTATDAHALVRRRVAKPTVDPTRVITAYFARTMRGKL